MGAGPNWTEAENLILWRMFGNASNAAIQAAILKETGRQRSENAIQCAANRLGITKQLDGAYTLQDVARHLGVTYHLIHGMSQAGKITTISRGKYRWVNLDELERLETLFPPAPARSMTKTEAMRRLGYCESHMHRLLLAGAIRGVRRGERWYVDADHIDALVAEMKRTGMTRLAWGDLPRLAAERAKSREYSRTKRKLVRQEARREIWYTQFAAARALGVGRDEMRRLLESGQVRGKRENNLWLAERSHIDELAAQRAAS